MAKAELHILEPIGGGFFGGMSSNRFMSILRGAGDVDEILLHINSPGGVAFEGIAIANLLRQHRARVTVQVDGLAASAASIIAMGADRIVMAEGSMMMIHNSAGFVMGTAADMRAVAGTLTKLDGEMAKIYARRSGDTAKAMKALMDAETWMTAEEAVEAGLADEVVAAPVDDGDAAPADGDEAEAWAALAASYKNMPETAKRFFAPAASAAAQADGPTRAAEQAGKPRDEEAAMDLKSLTLDQLQAGNPELVKQIQTAAAQAATEQAKTAMKPEVEAAIATAKADGETAERARCAAISAEAARLNLPAATVRTQIESGTDAQAAVGALKDAAIEALTKAAAAAVGAGEEEQPQTAAGKREKLAQRATEIQNTQQIGYIDALALAEKEMKR